MTGTNPTDRPHPAGTGASDDERRQLILTGEMLVRAGQLSQAEEVLRQALMRRPDDATATTHLARIMLRLGRTDDALRLLNDFLQSTKLPIPPELQLLRAQVLLDLRAWPEAITAFRNAIEAAPDNGSAELGLAIA